jgi:hypothetical protein
MVYPKSCSNGFKFWSLVGNVLEYLSSSEKQMIEGTISTRNTASHSNTNYSKYNNVTARSHNTSQ